MRGFLTQSCYGMSSGSIGGFVGIGGGMDGGGMPPSRGINKQELMQILDCVESRNIRVSLDSVSVAYVRALLKCIGESNDVEELWLNRGPLRADLSSSLACAIQTSRSLKTLRLREVDVDRFGASYIFQAIGESKTLREFYVDLNGFTIDRNNDLITAVRTNRSLKMLHIKDCNLGLDGSAALAHAVEANTTLEDLILQSTELQPGAGKGFGRAIRRNTTLKALYFLANPLLTAQDICDVFTGLHYSETLKILTLQDCEIDTGTAQYIATSLRKNKSLQKLCFWCNGMGPQEADVVAEYLKNNSTLRELRFRMNTIGDPGVQSIARALRHNKSLRLLDIGFTGVTETGLQPLVDVLKDTNFVLQTVEMYGNNTISSTSKVKKQLDHYLHLNRSLRCIWFENTFPLPLWAFALQRISNKKDRLFEALRRNPDLFKKTNK